MPRRIDIELTSRGSDGTFTWRAAGAKQPKGNVAESMVPDGAAVGTVLRAEVESGLEGVEIVALAAKAGPVEEKPANRIEVLGTPKRGPDVSVTLAPGSRRRRDGDDRPGRRDRRRDDRDRGEDRGDRPPRGEGGPQREGGPRRESGPRRDGPRRPSGDGPRTGSTDRRAAKPPTSTTHRNAMLATLGPEQLPVAEQLLRGGLPAVRQAIAEQAAKSTSGPVNSDAIVAIAEQLLPAVNLASWKDRATSAQAAGKELRLRDLRAVVAASRAVVLDDEGRAMAKALQDSLTQRVTALRDDWVARITTALDEHRVLDAIRTANRSPEPATRLPAELAVRISEAAGAAMAADVDPEAWLQLLDVVVESSVRRTVKPAGIPEAAETQEAARRAAGSVPELAKLLGLPIPPPPPPRRAPSRRVMAGGGGRPATSL